MMAKAHGLVCQPDGINYEHAGFKFCDLTQDEMKRLLQKGGVPMPGAGMMPPGDVMPPQPDAATRAVLDRLQATPKAQQAMMRIFMIESSMTGDPMMAAGNGKVSEIVVTKRNAVVLDEIKRQLALPDAPAEVAAFYGAGHLGFLERDLIEQLKLQPGDKQWSTGVSVSPADLGVTEEEFQLLRKFARSLAAFQNKMAKPQPKGDAPNVPEPDTRLRPQKGTGAN